MTGKKFTLIGTPQGHEIKDPSRDSHHLFYSTTALLTVASTELEFLPDVFNDFDVDFTSDPRAADAYRNDQRNIRKVREHTQHLKLNIIAPLRQGKRLLVLDLDYSEWHALYIARSLNSPACSNIGHEAADNGGTAAERMRTPAVAPISGGYLSLL